MEKAWAWHAMCESALYVTKLEQGCEKLSPSQKQPTKNYEPQRCSHIINNTTINQVLAALSHEYTEKNTVNAHPQTKEFMETQIPGC